MPRQAAHLERFTVTDATGTREVAGVEGIHPAGYLRPPSSGAVVLAYVSKPVAHEMPLLDFLSYLEEEGMDPARSGLAPRDTGGDRIRETFERCAKAIVAVAGRLGPVAETRLGCELELVPELSSEVPGASSEASKVPGASSDRPSKVRLLLRGQPLPDARVLLIPIAGDRPDVELRTDARGSVVLPEVGGAVVLHAVWGEPESTLSGRDASGAPRGDWRSAWASLTIRLPGSPAGGP